VFYANQFGRQPDLALRCATALTEYEEHLLEALEQREVSGVAAAAGDYGGDGISCTAEKLDQVSSEQTLYARARTLYSCSCAKSPSPHPVVSSAAPSSFSRAC
jgi:hypothetical protein